MIKEEVEVTEEIIEDCIKTRNKTDCKKHLKEDWENKKQLVKAVVKDLENH